MKNISKYWLLFMIAAMSATSCSDDDNEKVVMPDPDPTTLGWVKQATEFGTLPEYISVYKSPTELEGMKAIAFIAVADMSKANFATIGDQIYSKTPNQIWQAEQQKYPIIMNGGYFVMGAGKSVSLLCREGEVLAVNSQEEIRSQKSYYPTRGIFQLSKNGSFSTYWAYTTADGVTYTYEEPSPNKSGYEPQPIPSAYFPARGVKLNAETAIGGGPILLKDGNVRNTFTEELFDEESGVAPENYHPRTAIGVTANNKVVFFVCEGRSVTEGVKGMNMAMIANVLKSLGCVDAMNLDGGGSTCMLVNGQPVIKPSAGAQRAITTAVALK